MSPTIKATMALNKSNISVKLLRRRKWIKIARRNSSGEALGNGDDEANHSDSYLRDDGKEWKCAPTNGSIPIIYKYNIATQFRNFYMETNSYYCIKMCQY